MAENSFDEILDNIAKNPDIIEKLSTISEGISRENPYDSLPKIMSAIAPALQEKSSDEKGEKTDTPPEKNSLGDLGIPVAKLGEKIAKNSKLLLALKPYLNRERSEIIDTVIKLSQVTDLMKLIK